MSADECQVTEDGLDAVMEKFVISTGIRNVEQAAEHLAANALYQIEVDKVKSVVYDRKMVEKLCL